MGGLKTGNRVKAIKKHIQLVGQFSAALKYLSLNSEQKLEPEG